MNTGSYMNTRIRKSTGLTKKQIIDIFMKIREIVMKHVKTGITQERKDAAVKKINGLLSKLGLGYTIKKIEKSLLEKIMEKIMVKKTGGSVKDSLVKKLGIPTTIRPSTAELKFVKEVEEMNRKRRTLGTEGGSLDKQLSFFGDKKSKGKVRKYKK